MISDTALLERWTLRRDAEAFDEIVTRYAGLVYGTCRRILRNHADAEDIVQECFLKLAQAEPPPTCVGGWLHTVAVRAAGNFQKSRSRRKRLERQRAQSATGRAAAEPTWDDVQTYVDEAIAELPEDDRRVIVAHFLERKTHAAIAQELAVSRQAVTHRIARGLEALRSRLRRRGVGVGPAVLPAMLSQNVTESAPPSTLAILGKLALSGFVPKGAALESGSFVVGGALVMTKKVSVVAVLVVLLLGGIAGIAWWSGGGASESVKVVEPPRISTPDVRATVDLRGEQPPKEEEPAIADSEPQSPPAPLGVVICRIFDRATGQGLTDVPLVLEAVGAPANAELHVRERRAESESNGLYTFSNLPPGQYRFRFEPGAMDYVTPGYFRTPRAPHVELAEGDRRKDFEIALEPGGALSGTVVDSADRVIPGASVRIVSTESSYVYDGDSMYSSYESWEVGSDDEGRYRITGLITGATYVVLAVAEDLAPGASESVTLADAVEVEGVDVQLARGHRASGRFVDDAGEPVVDVAVSLGRAFPHTSSRFGLPEARTDGDGRFSFANVPPGEHVIFARTRDHHAGLQLSFHMPADREATDLVFELKRKKAGFLSGRVTDASGHPIVAEVSATATDGARGMASTRTARDGTFRLEDLGQSTTFDVNVRDLAGRYAREEQRGVAPNFSEIDFTLNEYASVRGRVVNAVSGEPIRSFEVRTISFRIRRGGTAGMWRTVTSERGEFSLENVDPPRSQLEFRAPGHSPVKTGVLELEPGERLEEDLTVELVEATPLEGTVLDGSTGEPIPETPVRVYTGSFSPYLLASGEVPFEGDTWFATTDSDGRFSFVGLDPDEIWNLVAWRPGSAAHIRVAVQPGEDGISLELRPEARLTVRTFRGEEPAKDLFVAISQLGQKDERSAYTNGRLQRTGAAEFVGLPAGRYEISFRDKHRKALGAVRKELQEGAVTEIDVDLENLATLDTR